MLPYRPDIKKDLLYEVRREKAKGVLRVRHNLSPHKPIPCSYLKCGLKSCPECMQEAAKSLAVRRNAMFRLNGWQGPAVCDEDVCAKAQKARWKKEAKERLRSWQGKVSNVRRADAKLPAGNQGTESDRPLTIPFSPIASPAGLRWLFPRQDLKDNVKNLFTPAVTSITAVVDLEAPVISPEIPTQNLEPLAPASGPVKLQPVAPTPVASTSPDVLEVSASKPCLPPPEFHSCSCMSLNSFSVTFSPFDTWGRSRRRRKRKSCGQRRKERAEKRSLAPPRMIWRPKVKKIPASPSALASSHGLPSRVPSVGVGPGRFMSRHRKDVSRVFRFRNKAEKLEVLSSMARQARRRQAVKHPSLETWSRGDLNLALDDPSTNSFYFRLSPRCMTFFLGEPLPDATPLLLGTYLHVEGLGRSPDEPRRKPLRLVGSSTHPGALLRPPDQ